MAQFEDLTPYRYGRGIESSAVLNVGWLGAEQPYPRARPTRELVDAIARCTTRVVAQRRGFHRCDLCSWEHGPPDRATHVYGGRTLTLGNGELRVAGSESTVFAAPTLLVHYVKEHDYGPPAAFVAALMSKAESLHVVSGDRFRALFALDSVQCFRITVRLLEAASRIIGREDGLEAAHALSAREDVVGTSEAMNVVPSSIPRSLGEEAGGDSPLGRIVLRVVGTIHDRADPERRASDVAECMEVAYDVGVDEAEIEEIRERSDSQVRS